jgi:hypothetical protein
MAKFFSDEEVQQAITLLNQQHPEVWPRIKDILRAPTEPKDPRVLMNAHLFNITFGQLPFIANIKDDRQRGLAKGNMITDVMDVARAELKQASTLKLEQWGQQRQSPSYSAATALAGGS